MLTTVPRGVEVGWFGLELGPIVMLHLLDVPNSLDIASAQTVWHGSQPVSVRFDLLDSGMSVSCCGCQVPPDRQYDGPWHVLEAGGDSVLPFNGILPNAGF